jgi:hypothetical protein
MKLAAYAIILLGLFLLALSAYDEHRQIASVVNPIGRYPRRFTVKKLDNFAQFRNLMTYEWLEAFAALAAGIILLRICRRADKLDPLSPDFAGNPESDELEKELDHESEPRKRPIK